MKRRSDYIADAARTVAFILDRRNMLPDAQFIVSFFLYMLDAEQAEREGRNGDALRMLSYAYHNAELNLGDDILRIVDTLLDQLMACRDRRCET